MFAPLYHGAMKHAVGPRREIGIRTIFNILGPISNPAFADAQVIGVCDRTFLEPLAHTLNNLGARHAFVVCGKDGLDEVTVTTTSLIAEVKDGAVTTYEFDPAEVGIRRARKEDLAGGDPAANARIIEAILKGEVGPRRDIVLLNVAFALIAAGAAHTVAEGLEAAARSIDSGAALEKLRRLREVSAR
jgi:anthranilate phosphoribosyltransferase